jgi:dipeptidase E
MMVQKTKRQIFGMNDNFYVAPWRPPVMQNHLLALSGKRTPRICLLSTASGDNPAVIERFYNALGGQRCLPRHLNMFAPCTSDFEGFLADQDIIYVEGGATRNLMAIWRDWKLDEALRSAWDAGVILSGQSAGAVCWFESCITDSLPSRLLPQACTGLVKGSASAHFDQQPGRPEVFRSLIADGEIPSPGIGLASHTAVHYVEGELVDVVCDKQGVHISMIERSDEGLRETQLEARYIGQ